MSIISESKVNNNKVPSHKSQFLGHKTEDGYIEQ